MDNKHQIMTELRAEFNRWEELLSSLSEAQINAPRLPDGRSIKDEVAHLLAWQQRSIARLEAALHGGAPVFPDWPEGDPEVEELLDRTNAWIDATYRDQPWTSVYGLWRAGFLRLLELAEAIPEHDLMAPAVYPWLDGEPLALVLLGTYEHHHIDHLEPLLAQLQQDGDGAGAAT